MKISKYLPILKIGAEGKGNRTFENLQNDGLNKMSADPSESNEH